VHETAKMARTLGRPLATIEEARKMTGIKTSTTKQL
jgi:hypothetical protein